MANEQLKGNWVQAKSEIQKKWGKITDNDWDVVKGDAGKLAGKLTEYYGIAKDEAVKEATNVIKLLKGNDNGHGGYAGTFNDYLQKGQEKLNESAELVSKKSGEVYDAFTDVIKRNPITAISLAVIGGALVYKMLHK